MARSTVLETFSSAEAPLLTSEEAWLTFEMVEEQETVKVTNAAIRKVFIDISMTTYRLKHGRNLVLIFPSLISDLAIRFITDIKQSEARKLFLRS